MRDYHEYPKIFIGDSDVAALILVGAHSNRPMHSTVLRFGIDASYHAYVVDQEADIPDSYKIMAEFDHWMKIYDDEALVFSTSGTHTDYTPHISVYRRGDCGCIIKIEPLT